MAILAMDITFVPSVIPTHLKNMVVPSMAGTFHVSNAHIQHVLWRVVPMVETASKSLHVRFVEKEVAPVHRASLPAVLHARRYQPEFWNALEPVAFVKTDVGVRGSPTIVSKAFTMPAKDPGPRLVIEEVGLAEAVNQAWEQVPWS